MAEVLKAAPLALANTFIARHGAGSGIDHMKLQKLCYYAHGWWLSYYPEPFLTDRPEVWRHGPVFRKLYATLANYGAATILRPQRAVPFGEAPVIEIHEQLDLIDWIWGKYGAFSAFTLSDMTHAPGTPWRQIAEKFNFEVPKGFELPDDLVAAFFKREAAELAT